MWVDKQRCKGFDEPVQIWLSDGALCILGSNEPCCIWFDEPCCISFDELCCMYSNEPCCMWFDKLRCLCFNKPCCMWSFNVWDLHQNRANDQSIDACAFTCTKYHSCSWIPGCEQACCHGCDCRWPHTAPCPTPSLHAQQGTMVSGAADNRSRGRVRDGDGHGGGGGGGGGGGSGGGAGGAGEGPRSASTNEQTRWCVRWGWLMPCRHHWNHRFRPTLIGT